MGPLFEGQVANFGEKSSFFSFFDILSRLIYLQWSKVVLGGFWTFWTKLAEKSGKIAKILHFLALCQGKKDDFWPILAQSRSQNRYFQLSDPIEWEIIGFMTFIEILWSSARPGGSVDFYLQILVQNRRFRAKMALVGSTFRVYRGQKEAILALKWSIVNQNSQIKRLQNPRAPQNFDRNNKIVNFPLYGTNG